jgi:predicted nucleic acid-binding protein
MRRQVYLDTSALVKRYIQEPGSQDMARLLAEAEHQAVSVVVEAEIPAALARAVRVGAIGPEDGEAALQTWEQEREHLVWVQLPQSIARQAGELAWRDGLRGYAAIHLATALWWQANVGRDLVVATYDRELWCAVRRHGLDAFPEQDHWSGGAPLSS